MGSVIDVEDYEKRLRRMGWVIVGLLIIAVVVLCWAYGLLDGTAPELFK